uniref:Uncharacterized protein n=1 Tax=Coccidioides posadasii RMSCC 3488 TaxID=454284 RepID=A0A0J6FHY8_COCPO|nr:hypothetical protein CPAG_05313 [Coccidioides posadasii RMSCC 3488]
MDKKLLADHGGSARSSQLQDTMKIIPGKQGGKRDRPRGCAEGETKRTGPSFLRFPNEPAMNTGGLVSACERGTTSICIVRMGGYGFQAHGEQGGITYPLTKRQRLYERLINAAADFLGFAIAGKVRRIASHSRAPIPAPPEEELSSSNKLVS